MKDVLCESDRGIAEQSERPTQLTGQLDNLGDDSS